MKEMKKIILQVERFVEEKLKDMPEVLSHTGRVKRYAIFIAEREKADADLVSIAASLHDVGYAVHPTNHRVYSVQLAKDFLSKFEVNNMDVTLNAIEHGGEPKTLEAKIICDADALDRLGPVGLVRLTIYFFREHQISDPKEILQRVNNFMASSVRNLYTSTALKIASSKILDLSKFVEIFDIQWRSQIDEFFLVVT